MIEELKKIEGAIKAEVNLKAFEELKVKARRVIELKQECVVLLDEMGVDSEESKKLIDYVNSLPQTQLTEQDKVDLVKRVKNELQFKQNVVRAEYLANPMEFLQSHGTAAITGYLVDNPNFKVVVS